MKYIRELNIRPHAWAASNFGITTRPVVYSPTILSPAVSLSLSASLPRSSTIPQLHELILVIYSHTARTLPTLVMLSPEPFVLAPVGPHEHSTPGPFRPPHYPRLPILPRLASPTPKTDIHAYPSRTLNSVHALFPLLSYTIPPSHSALSFQAIPGHASPTRAYLSAPSLSPAQHSPATPLAIRPF